MSTTLNPLHTLIHTLSEAKAFEVTTLDVRQQTSITDHMVICTGRSSRHVKAIAQIAMDALRLIGIPAMSQTGLVNGDWVLIDFGDVILHVMQAESRTFYQLEDHWQASAA